VQNCLDEDLRSSDRDDWNSPQSSPISFFATRCQRVVWVVFTGVI
jgi:hypothetical protein